MYTTPWSEEHKEIIRQHYPVGGPDLCVLKLGNSRTREAVKIMAKKLKVRAPGLPPVYKRPKLPTSDHIDADIIRTYQKTPQSNDINALAKRVCRTRHWVLKRAVQLGVAVPKFNRPWSDEERMIVDVYSNYPPRRIQRELRKAGFKRSLAAITHKRKFMKLRPDDGIYNASQLAQLMGVSLFKIRRLIKGGMLRAKRVGSARTDEQGDIYEIRDVWIREFFTQYPGEFDHRKVDKFWLIDILTAPAFRRRLKAVA